MDTQETIENDKLAAAFQALLIQELQQRGVHFTNATAVNFSDVNIDVHIWIEDYWGLYLFKYIGISWLKHHKLPETTLETYVKGYVDRGLKELKEDVESAINECLKRLEHKSNMTQGFLRDTEKRLEAARKIASWLV